MANSTTGIRPEKGRDAVCALGMTLPMALWTLLVFSPVLRRPGAREPIAALTVALFTTTLFFLMLRTGKTYRWRRYAAGCCQHCPWHSDLDLP